MEDIPLGQAYEQKGMLKEAIAELEKAAASHKELPSTQLLWRTHTPLPVDAARRKRCCAKRTSERTALTFHLSTLRSSTPDLDERMSR
jgi:hypothetical protein